MPWAGRHGRRGPRSAVGAQVGARCYQRGRHAHRDHRHPPDQRHTHNGFGYEVCNFGQRSSTLWTNWADNGNPDSGGCHWKESQF